MRIYLLITAVVSAFCFVEPVSGSVEDALLKMDRDGFDKVLSMEGVWTSNHNGEHRVKMISAGHFMITSSDPETGKVHFSHGGLYTFKDGVYSEKIVYATGRTVDLIGKTFTFRIRFFENKYTHIGINNDFYDETYIRANREAL